MALVDTLFDTRVNNPRSFPIYYAEFMSFSIVAIILGISIDIIFTYVLASLQHYFQVQRRFAVVIRYVTSALQISVGAIVLYVLAYVTRPWKWAEQWQDTIAGIAFTAFFYGVQSNLFFMLHHHSHPVQYS